MPQSQNLALKIYLGQIVTPYQSLMKIYGRVVFEKILALPKKCFLNFSSSGMAVINDQLFLLVHF